MWSKFKTDEKGFTGLEAAIVLVAFVVVAAVFSYVMLGAGFFTTQKSQEVVHTGVTQASSSLAPSGDVIVTGDATNTIPTVILYVTNTAGGTTVDLDKTVVSYTDSDDYVSKAYVDGGTAGWDYLEVIAATGSAENLVDKGEKYRITLTLETLGATTLPGVNEGIKIEVKPPEGAVLILTRTMPPAIEDATNYVVY